MTDLNNVYQAVSLVQADLCRVGISKDSKNKQQGFQFRGIDQLYNALSPSLSKHGLIITQEVTDRTSVKVATKSGGSMSHHIVNVTYTLHGPDGSSLSCKTLGEAMDSGDKGIAKSLTAAYKYLLLQIFCVPLEGQPDADSESHEVTTEPEAMKKLNAPTPITDLQCQQIKAGLESSRADVRAFLKYFGVASVEKLTSEQWPKASTMIKKKISDMTAEDIL